MIVFNSNLNYNYNPFGGLSPRELNEVLVPNECTERIIKNIEGEGGQIIELVGKKGRGKTSHLKVLNQLYHWAPLFLLSQKQNHFTEIIEHECDTVFVDSIHHLSLLQRIKLFKAKKKIILTTHCSRLLEYKLAGVPFNSYRFKGIDLERMSDIIRNRIIQAIDNKEETIKINKEEVKKLIKKYGDNYRSILKELYEKFNGQ